MKILAVVAIIGWSLAASLYVGIINRGYDIHIVAFNEKGYTPAELDAMDKLTQVYGE